MMRMRLLSLLAVFNTDSLFADMMRRIVAHAMPYASYMERDCRVAECQQ